MIKVVDPHLHLFALEQGNYFWLNEGNAPYWPDKEKIRKSYFESDLILSPPHQLAGFVHIEAGFDNEQPHREIAWLEEHCSLPFRSIAFADLTSPQCIQKLAQLKPFKSVVGVRHILDEQAVDLLSQETFQRNLRLLADYGLVFEAQLILDNLPAVKLLAEVVQEIPKLKVVINHCGFPQNLSDEWIDSITRLAHLPECSIKCSGWEMVDRNWTADQVKPFINFAIRQFGLTRVMLASNFPVSELSYSYAEIWQRYLNEMEWKGFEKEMLVYENARRIYKLHL